MTGLPATEPAPSIHLLRTKLFIPRAHPDLVSRPWLSGRLNEGARSKLTLVSAPAGFGKTTLLSKWIADRQDDTRARQRFCWVSLDPGDNDPTRFWGYFISALQTLRPETGRTALGMIQSPQPPAIDTILTEILNDLALEADELVLVLDDYHVIENPDLHQGLNFFLDHVSPHIHLVIASRSEPPLPLHLLRVRRELVELNLSDLRFTSSEVAIFFNQVMRLNLTSGDISALDKLTEGWVAGLQLAALSMQGVEDVSAFLRAFTGSHRYIFDYLAQEVLNRQPAQIQDFLLRTSILERMNAPLCNALFNSTDNACQVILEQLEQANLFIVHLDQQRNWYRYHHLFSDFLRTRLEQSATPEEISALHMRACSWCEHSGWFSEAFSHAMAAGQPKQAARLLSQAAEGMFTRSELITIIKWVETLPKETVHEDARLNIIYAWAKLATGQLEAVETLLANIERILGVTADGSPASMALPAEKRGALAEISNLRASQAFNRGDIEAAMQLGQQARAYLADDVISGMFQTRVGLLSIASFNMAVAYEFSGKVPEALQAFEEAITLSRRDQNYHLLPMAISHRASLLSIQGHLKQACQVYLEAQRDVDLSARPSPLAGMVYTGIGNLYCEWNDLVQAEAHLKKGIEMGKQWSSWEILTAGYFGLARCEIARGDLPAAMALLQEVEALRQKLQLPWAEGATYSQTALVSALMGDHTAASHWADGLQRVLQAGIPFTLETEALILGRVLLYLGKTQEANVLLENILAGAEAGQRWGRVVAALALRALSQSALGNNAQAATSLLRAVELAEPEGYQRIFLDEGEPMLKQLSDVSRQLAAHSSRQSEAASAYIQKLLSIVNRPTSRTGATSADTTLSARELEVLRLMAIGHTNQQIADQLYISLNTVKSHIKNILGHLEVENRTQAVARARLLGLL